eukprot:Rmarinus@m.5638
MTLTESRSTLSVKYLHTSGQQGFRLQEYTPPSWSSTNILSVLKSVYLPTGYPTAVTDDYIEYQVFDTLQGLCSYLRGIISTRAILQGVGVGDATKDATAAVLQYIIRDSSGMVGGLLLAAWKGSSFDANAKSWRLLADVLNDVGLTLELFSPLFEGPYFLLAASVGNICKAMCGVAAGATKAAFTHHFAKTNNHADIAAKEGSQETTVNLIGLFLGYLLASQLDRFSSFSLYIFFLVLTVLHVYFNFRALRGVHLTTLNRERASLVVDRFCTDTDSCEPEAINPKTICQKEVFWEWSGLTLVCPRSWPRIDIGARLSDLTMSPTVMEGLISIYHNENFLVAPSLRDPSRIAIVLHSRASTADKLSGFFQAWCLYIAKEKCPELQCVSDDTAVPKVVSIARKRASLLYPRFCDLASRAGWTLALECIDHGWRADWSSCLKDV